jgi:hypothetical protein
MRPYEALWNPVEPYEAPWSPIEHHGGLWTFKVPALSRKPYETL